MGFNNNVGNLPLTNQI